MSDQLDAEAIEAIRQGDPERYRELIERYERQVFAVAWCRLGDADLAEEAAQEAFIKGFRHLPFLSHREKFAAWITSIARNAAINLGLRRRRELNQRERWGLDYAESLAPAADGSARDEEPKPAQTLRAALALLPAHHRECLVLFYLEDRSGAEAAAKLGLSESAFRTRLHRAKRALREQLETGLERSLGNLRPGKALTPVIMGILAAQQFKVSAATGLGGALLKAGAGTAKLLPFQHVIAIPMLLAQLPVLLLEFWFGYLEKRNFRNPKDFRLHRHWRNIGWICGLVLVFSIPNLFPAFFLPHFRGVLTFFGLLGLAFIPALMHSARRFALNHTSFATGQLALQALAVFFLITVGFGSVPIGVMLLFGLVMQFLVILTLRNAPSRKDYNLFLRQVMGMIPGPPSAPPSSRAEAGRLTPAEVLAFGRFLGDRWLVNDFRKGTDGFLYRLPTSRLSLSPIVSPVSWGMSAFLWGKNSSQLHISWDGSVRARVGRRDFKDLSERADLRDLRKDDLERCVARAVEKALGYFLAGETEAAEKWVGQVPEADIFLVPPRQSAATRWRIVLLAGLGIAAIVSSVLVQTSVREIQEIGDGSSTASPAWSSVFWRAMTYRIDIRWMETSESEVRNTLGRLARTKKEEPTAWLFFDVMGNSQMTLPPKEFFTPGAWKRVHAQLHEKIGGAGALPKSEPLEMIGAMLRANEVGKAILSGLIAPADLAAMGITAAGVRDYLVQLGPPTLNRLTQLNEIKRRQDPSSFLYVRDVAPRLQLLHHFGCLDLVDARPLIEKLQAEQILGNRFPAGRKPVSDTRVLQGLFFPCGMDPLEDTYESLLILSLVGGLDQIDKQACVDGILRLHLGGGSFRLDRKEDQILMMGGPKDAFYAYESLRLLGALNQVKDLHRWKFAMPGRLISQRGGEVGQVLNGDELMGWFYQQRFDRFIAARRTDPMSPAPSLQKP